MSNELIKLGTAPTTAPPVPQPEDLESLLGIDECVRYYPPNLDAVPDAQAIFRTDAPLGEVDVFVDFPFCSTICGFCPFNVYKFGNADVDGYLRALAKEIDVLNALHDFRRTRVKTIWVGGGTPSLLEDSALDTLLSTLRDSFDLSRRDEFTVEVKPVRTVITDSKLAVLRKHGIERVSMGVQSTSDEFLELLGRGHSAEEPLRVIETIKSAGFDLNIDMMYRLPGQTLAQVERDVDAVRSLGIDHISWFPYVPHDGTPLAKKMIGGRVPQNVDRAGYFEMFQRVLALMTDAGYEQYTPWHYAKPGKRCQHHVGRWRMPQTDTLGLGSGAFSFFNGWIYADEHNPQRYREVVDAGKPPVQKGKKLTPTERITRLAVLGIKFFRLDAAEFRRASGVDLHAYYAAELDLLARLGLVEITNDAVECTLLGKAFNNDIASLFGTDVSRRTKHPQAIDLMRVKQL